MSAAETRTSRAASSRWTPAQHGRSAGTDPNHVDLPIEDNVEPAAREGNDTQSVPKVPPDPPGRGDDEDRGEELAPNVQANLDRPRSAAQRLRLPDRRR